MTNRNLTINLSPTSAFIIELQEINHQFDRFESLDELLVSDIVHTSLFVGNRNLGITIEDVYKLVSKEYLMMDNGDYTFDQLIYGLVASITDEYTFFENIYFSYYPNNLEQFESFMKIVYSNAEAAIEQIFFPEEVIGDWSDEDMQY